MNTRAPHRADYSLLLLFFGVLLFGLLMLASASAPIGVQRFADAQFFIKRQLLYGVLPGIVAFFFFVRLPYSVLEKYATAIYGLSILMLILVFIPGIGSSLNTGAHSWLIVAGISFQPAEFAKVATVIFLSALIAKKGSQMADLEHGFFPVLLMSMLPIALIAIQPDVGTLAIVFSIVFGMLYVSEAKLRFIGGLALVGVVAFCLLILIAPYRLKRITTFLHPELDPQGIGYQISQAQVAIGSGGVFGVGISQSKQKFQYLPEVHADSIFAVIAEETGFITSTILVIAFVLIGFRGFRIARRAPDRFGTCLATGITLWFLSQAFLNIGAIVGLLPLTGVPLPFVSHGGTALFIAMAAVGILLNVSRYAKTE